MPDDEVLTLTVRHGPDDLREWTTRLGGRVTLQRLAVTAVTAVAEGERGCLRGCEVVYGHGRVWELDEGYADVVAWWRGDAPALTADCVAEWEVGP